MGRSDAQLADKYAMNKPGDQDHYMLLAKFSQGRRAAGRLRGDIEPGFDSRVDNLDSPKIFVAPSAMQVKPIAIIRYSNNSTAAAGFNVRRASGATVPAQSPAPLPTPPYVQPTLPVQHDTLGVGGGARGGRPLHGSQDPLPEMLRDKAAAQGKAAAVYKAAEEVAEAKMDNGVRINQAFRRRHGRAVVPACVREEERVGVAVGWRQPPAAERARAARVDHRDVPHLRPAPVLFFFFTVAPYVLQSWIPARAVALIIVMFSM